jgi:hypothetical protein
VCGWMEQCLVWRENRLGKAAGIAGIGGRHSDGSIVPAAGGLRMMPLLPNSPIAHSIDGTSQYISRRSPGDLCQLGA